MENPNYYAVIPAEVRYDNKLKANEKLLYGEITALANKNGYCNASNSYFADLYEKHKDTISDWINNLKQAGYIETEFIKDELGKVEERRIYLSVKTPRGYRQKHLGGIGENTLGNITSNNNIEEEKENKRESENEKQKIIKFYEDNITLITQFVSEDMDKYLETMEGELIIEAIKEAASRNSRTWKYITGILNNCVNKGIKTVSEFKQSQEEFKEQQKKKKESNTRNKQEKKQEIEYNTDFSEYEQYAKAERIKDG